MPPPREVMIGIDAGTTAVKAAALSLGTSGAVRLLVGETVSDRLFRYALTEDLWVVGGAVSNGGSVVRWAADVFGGLDESGGAGACRCCSGGQ
ncbi:hypothetical protein AB0F72_17430 [Actinoplanes sp. NPDC023936]|uniref:hypothetical protein n=1 Tax=Actinoplanes sp. NPDC023936 TaxID=3154910 RepID=UPI0033F0AA10